MGGGREGAYPHCAHRENISHPYAQIFIKDVKSSNGTFINSEQLSPEGVESEPFELKSNDIVVSPSPPVKIASRIQRHFLFPLLGIRDRHRWRGQQDHYSPQSCRPGGVHVQ